jgi:hypothetical protein
MNQDKLVRVLEKLRFNFVLVKLDPVHEKNPYLSHIFYSCIPFFKH